MIIGVDLDNTLICYDDVFAEVAVMQGWLPIYTPRDKASVKKAVQSAHGNSVWTELQGLVYGQFINQAEAYAGSLETLQALVGAGHTLYIISHKTKFPAVGDKTDLRSAATGWLQANGFLDVVHSLSFCDTREEKVERIVDYNCNVFIDDLSAVLEHPRLPKKVQRILFDPTGDLNNSLSSWNAIAGVLPPKVKARREI